MTDELSIQQAKQTGSYAFPGLFGGGVVGGVGGYFAGKNGYGFTSKPNLDEVFKQDADTFKSQIEQAGDNKGAWEKAQEWSKKIKNAENDYNAQIEAIKAEHKAPTKLPASNPAQLRLAEAQHEYDRAFEAAKKIFAENSTVASTATEKKSVYDSVKGIVDAIVDRTEYLEKLQRENAPKEKIAAVRKSITTLEQKADKLAETIADKLEYKSKGYVSDTKKTVVDSLKQSIKDYKEARFAHKDLDKRPKVVIDLIENQSKQANARKAITVAEDKLKTLLGNPGDLNSAILAKSNKEDKLIEVLEKYKKAFADESKGTKAIPTDDELKKALYDYLKGNKQNTINETLKEADKKQYAKIEKLLKGEVNAETIEEALNAAQKRKDAIGTASRDYYFAKVNLDKLVWREKGLELNETGSLVKSKTKGLIEQLEGLYGKGAHIKNGVIYDAKHNVIKLEGPAAPKVKFNIPSGVRGLESATIEVPKNVTVTEKLSAEEIANRARTALTEHKVASNLEAAQKAVNEELAKLGKEATELSKEELEKILKEKGIAASKEEFTKSLTDQAKKELEPMIEKMKLPNVLKTAGIAGAVLAIAGLGIGAMMKKDA